MSTLYEIRIRVLHDGDDYEDTSLQYVSEEEARISFTVLQNLVKLNRPIGKASASSWFGDDEGLSQAVAAQDLLIMQLARDLGYYSYVDKVYSLSRVTSEILAVP